MTTRSRSTLRALGALCLLAAGLVGVVPVGAPTAAVAAADTGSAVTVSGRMGVFGDDYTGMRITVSQTRGLTSQGITISWTGAKPTTPRDNTPSEPAARNFLQIMQCWGPDPSAADFRETCQWGGAPRENSPRRTPYATDPNETLPDDAKMVPFRSRDGSVASHGGAAAPWKPLPCQPGTTCGEPVEADELSPFFNQYTSNEVYSAFTAADGTGSVVFETQTSLEAPALGCGLAGQLDCWLVIVPRGEHNAVGETAPAAQIQNGPLAASPFADRIAVKLTFQEVGAYCPTGAQERRTLGSELVGPAMNSWQPALCADNGPVYGYVSAAESTVQSEVLSASEGAAGLGFVTDPVVPGEGRPAVLHAPVALSGVVIAFNVDMRLDPGITEGSVSPGSMIRDIRLTPRLLAKLLTQSYKRDVPGGNFADYLADNPRTIRNDEEFLALNPVFREYATSANFDGLMVTAGTTAYAEEIWRYVLADPEALDWLQGGPDGNNPPMTVNPNYLSFFANGEAPGNFPKADPRTYTATGATEPFPTLDLRPYLGSLNETAYQTLRADAKNQTDWRIDTVPNDYKRFAPQTVPNRFAMGVTDSVSAQRYGLVTASLRNGAGRFVSATDASMLAAVDDMVPSTDVPGVLHTDRTKAASAGAYPLTMITYAVADTTEPNDARAAYAGLLRYAAGAGQTSGVERGQLPLGYAPLPDAMRAQTVAVADQLGKAVAPSVTPTTAEPVAAGGGDPGTSSTGGPGAGVAAGVPNPGVKPSGIVPATPVSARPSTQPAEAITRVTDGTPIGWIRWVLLVALIAGGLAAIAGPVLLRVGTRIARRGG